MKEASNFEEGPADADGLVVEEINIVDKSARGEEDEIQPSHGDEKSDADVNKDEGEESSDDEEYSHLRSLLESRDRVLGRGRLED